MNKKFEETNMMSLYDYLGHKGGLELGSEVCSSAIKLNVPLGSREISNPAYEGTVRLYPQAFLKYYFNDDLRKYKLEESKILTNTP